jgi:uncharacterized cupredoxin-like copper-binding protein
LVSSGLFTRLAAGAALLTLGVGCGAQDRPSSALTVIRVKEKDFRIVAKPRVVPAGHVRFDVTNDGPVAHELIVIRQNGHMLPFRSDRLTIDEERVEPETVGALEPGDLGVRHLEADLRPGTYELICNMAGHYLGGMRLRLVVT